MLASLKNCVLSLARDKALLVWALAFPAIMTFIFMGMFSGIQDAYTTVGSTLGVVRDKNYSAALGLDETHPGHLGPCVERPHLRRGLLRKRRRRRSRR